MATWDDTLQPASFDGIEFPVSSRSVSGGRAWARRRYPNRPGQGSEDTGREPYRFELEIPLFHGVNSGHYPTLFEQLRAAFDDVETTGEAEYVDPLIGPVNAKVSEPWQWVESADQRDGGILRVVLEEVTFDDQLVTIGVGDPRATAESQAETLDSALEDFGIAEADLEEDFVAAGAPLTEDELDRGDGTMWATQVTRFVEGLEDGFESAEEVADRVDTIRRRLDVMANREELQSPAGVHALHAAMRLGVALTDVGARAVIDAPPLVVHRVATRMSIYEVASLLYGTADRAEEILQRNPQQAPLFLAAGTELVVLAA